MTTDYRQFYLDDTHTLAKTLVVKSQTAIDLINSFLVLRFGPSAVNADDLTSWKYYKNVCGQYHYSDTMMRIISLDTLEEIDFTIDNLKFHTATAAAYQYGSRYYYALLNAYPDQEQLILGILYPADMEYAIAAEDKTILSYPKGLVEPQEITLMDELQAWIYNYHVRWDVKAFGISDSLYPVVQHAIFYLQLVPKLFNLRLKRCKTSEAHSFHIRSFLASHSGLDKHFDFMTIKQALFLYRNLEYIEHHAGHSWIFKWLVDRLLTERQIPIAEFQAKLESTFDDEYYPTYQFKKKPINQLSNSTSQNDYPLDSLLSREEPFAPGNIEYRIESLTTIDKKFKNSLFSVLKTKDLESAMVDYSNYHPITLPEVLMKYWGWLAANNLYRVAIVFKDPRTDAIQTMFSDDAFVYWIYITMRGLGAPIDTVPKFLSLRVQPLTPPSVEDLLSVVDRKIIKDRLVAEWLISKQPYLRECYSVSAFLQFATKCFEVESEHWYLRSRTEDIYERALVENMTHRLFVDSEISFDGTGMSMSDWLHSKSLPTTEYTSEECQLLSADIFKAATGYDVNETSRIGNIQRAMLSIMSQLSSYSVQYIRRINEDGVVPLAWAAIRTGNLSGTGIGQVAKHLGSFVIDVDAEQYQHYKVDPNPPVTIDLIESSQSNRTDIRLQSEIKISPNNHIEQPVLFKQFDVKASYDKYDPEVSDNTLFIGFEYYLDLSTAQKSKVVDIYNTPVLQITDPTAQQNIADIIPYDVLSPTSNISLSSQTLIIKE